MPEPSSPGASTRELFAFAARLAGRGEPFVLATVVRRTPPSSARPGARALVTRDGRMRGWLGGSCLEPTVRREALRALEDGEPRLLVFAPDPDAAERPGAHVHPMTCHSGGTVEIHVEPVLPEPTLELYGDSPVVRALAEMAPAAGFRVEVTAEPPAGAAASSSASGDERPGEAAGGPADAGEVVGGGAGRWAVVATMGLWDADAVRRALAGGAGYVGLVASPRRAGEVRRRLELEEDPRLVSPAGLDLGAREPGEIAVTILAEVIRLRRAAGGEAEGEGGAVPPAARGRRPAAGAVGGEAEGGAGAGAAGAEAAPGATATDPVCGMEVEIEGARHRATHGGEEFYFCCPGCREAFVEDPDAVLASSG